MPVASTTPRLLRPLASGATFVVDLVEVEGVLAVEKRVAPALVGSPEADAMLAREADFLAAVPALACLPRLLAHLVPDVDRPRRVIESFIEGDTLVDALARTDDLAQRCALLLATCDAVTAIHDARDAAGDPLGAFHGDVSPSNLIVTPAGAIVAIDLGAAGTFALAPGASRGTPLFATPEVTRGDARVGQASDRHAVAALATEALTRGLVVAGAPGTRVRDLPLPARLLAIGERGVAPPPDDPATETIGPALDALLAFDPAARSSSLASLRSAIFSLAARARTGEILDPR